MTIITEAQIQALRAQCAGNLKAAEQAEWFITAALAGDSDTRQCADNPDLVDALGGEPADRFLGIKL